MNLDNLFFWRRISRLQAANVSLKATVRNQTRSLQEYKEANDFLSVKNSELNAALLKLVEQSVMRPAPQPEQPKEKERKPLSKPRVTGSQFLRRLEQEAAKEAKDEALTTL